MKIRCNKCRREMDLSEFLSYPASYAIKILIPLCIAILTDEIRRRSQQPTRSLFDNFFSMAGYANNFAIECPTCKVTGCWDPVDEEKEQKELALKKAKKRRQRKKQKEQTA